MRIVLTGGGSGGHLVPLVAVAEKIRAKKSGAQFLFIGPNGQLEKEIMEKHQIPAKKIMAGKMRRYFAIANFFDVFRVVIGFFQALWHLLFFMPDAIFSKGGFASVSVVIAGWIYRIPILIHESDSKPGLANSILGKFANRVAVSYPESEKEFVAEQVVLTGNPLREDINQGNPQKVREIFPLRSDRKIIFAWGGSQGAKTINHKIIDLLPELLSFSDVIHQTGERNLEESKHRAAELGIKAGREGYYPIGFINDELKDILAAADLVISRAGANSISEIAANGKPAIIIPIEKSANDHQKMNAFSLAKIGGCVVLEENNLGENLLLSRIKEILDDEAFRQKLSTSIRSFYHPDATEKIAEGVLGMIK